MERLVRVVQLVKSCISLVKLKAHVIQLVKLVHKQERVQVEILALNLQYTTCKFKRALKSKTSSYSSYLDF